MTGSRGASIHVGFGERRIRAAIGLMLGAFVAFATQPALAGDVAVDTATAHFDQGVQMFERDDFVGALEQFELADKAHHVPTITYNIARARESLGQAQGAYEAYEAYIGEAGSQADYLDAATVALARIKARATRLRVETVPAGAVVRIDGLPLKDRSPVTALVFKGQHRIEGDWDGRVEARDMTAQGNGESTDLQLTKREEPKAPVMAPPPKPGPSEPSGLMAGVGFSLNYTALVVKETPSEQAIADPDTPAYRNSALMFGAVLEAGYPFSKRSVLMLRLHCGLGSTEKALFSLGAVSVGYSWRASPGWWIGGGAIAGSSDKDIGATYSPLIGARSDDKIVFVNNAAVGPTLEAGLVLNDGPKGMWLLSAHPSLLLGTGQGQSTLYVPLAASYRWY